MRGRDYFGCFFEESGLFYSYFFLIESLGLREYQASFSLRKQGGPKFWEMLQSDIGGLSEWLRSWSHRRECSSTCRWT